MEGLLRVEIFQASLFWHPSTSPDINKKILVKYLKGQPIHMLILYLTDFMSKSIFLFQVNEKVLVNICFPLFIKTLIFYTFYERCSLPTKLFARYPLEFFRKIMKRFSLQIFQLGRSMQSM